MISIRKYLNGAPAKAGGPELEEPESAAFSGFAAGVLENIERHVLSGEQDEPLRAQIMQVRGEIRPDWPFKEGSKALESVRIVLAKKSEALQQKGVKQAVEVQHIFAMLNQALIVLAEGKDRSVARLNRIQDSLRRTCMIDDIVALKSCLSETMRFIKTESAQTQEASTQELAKFDTEVVKVREFLGNTRLEMAGRPEGVSRITDSLKTLPVGDGLYLVALVLDRMQAFIQRYGPPVAEELVFRVIKERLQPIVTGNTTFRWTSSSLVAVFSGQMDLAALRTQVKEMNNAPLVHRIALGSRTAVLTIKPSHLVAEGVPGSPERLVELVDQFTGAQP